MVLLIKSTSMHEFWQNLLKLSIRVSFSISSRCQRVSAWHSYHFQRFLSSHAARPVIELCSHSSTPCLPIKPIVKTTLKIITQKLG